MKIRETPYISKRVDVGDIITSSKFAIGHLTHGQTDILVGGSRKLCDDFDRSRAKGKYVVISAKMVTDPYGMDSWPDGWYVTAKRLNSDMKDDGLGEVISFYQYFLNGDASYGLIKEVTVIGEMEQRFV